MGAFGGMLISRNQVEQDKGMRFLYRTDFIRIVNTFLTRWFLCSLIFIKKLSLLCKEWFPHVLQGKQYDKEVQGGSHIREPGTLCVS